MHLSRLTGPLKLKSAALRKTTDMVTLYYIHDPMCSWCWGFRPVWQTVVRELSSHPTGRKIRIQYLLGGLAADTSDPMPVALQKTIRQTWGTIQQSVPGTKFNFDFWHQCQPRRSTYPACRAIIAAREQDNTGNATNYAADMLYAIQQAYYLQARNPSDDNTLIYLADMLGLDTEQFRLTLNAAATQQQLLLEIERSRELGAYSFPSLILQNTIESRVINIDYNQSDTILRQIIDAS